MEVVVVEFEVAFLRAPLPPLVMADAVNMNEIYILKNSWN